MMNWSSVVVLIALNVVFNQFATGIPFPQSETTPAPTSASNSLINQNPFGSLMSPLAGYTGFRSSMDDIAGTFGNMGASLGNMVNSLFSGTLGAVGGLIDSWFGMGVMNRLNSPTYITQLTPQSKAQPSAQSAATTQSPTTAAPTTAAPTTTAKPA